MRHEGYIKGYKIVYENQYDLSDKCYLAATYYAVRQCLEVLPPDILLDDFLKGMMSLTRGTINPQIIKEVYDDIQKEI